MIALRPAAGLGAPLLAFTLIAQLLVPLCVVPQAPAPEAPSVRSLSAAAVVEPRIGGVPGPLLSGARQAAGSRAQVSFTTSHELWTAVLWFEGNERVVPLYPRRDQAGWTAAETTYAVPGPDAWLRLTPTGAVDDLLVVVSALRPDPHIVATLASPRAERVRALRSHLEARIAHNPAERTAVERFLPTADGRVVGVPWSTVWGTDILVIGWRIAVDSPAWEAPGMSSSSAPGSRERSSPSAS